MVNKWGFVSVFVLVCLMAFTASANVVLTIGNNVTLSFDDVEANFAPSVKSSGNCGILYAADPLDACLPLTNIVDPTEDINKSPFVLIIRGGCSFEEKARKAQVAGFKAVIVYDNEYGDLVAMAGNAVGIKIPAIFISKDSGQTLIKYANNNNTEVWLIPSFENSAWSIMAISFISLLAMSAVLATCFFVRRHQIRRDRPRNSRVRSFHGMSSRLVNALPSLVFTSALEDNVNSTSLTCSICLEDYAHGDKIRLLPCRHKFHVTCVDAWLTKQRTFCPVCKRDARTLNGEPPASESTPLLSSTSSSVSSSFRSSVSSSSAIQILSPINTPYNQHYLLQSYHQSPHLSINQNGSSQRSLGSYILSSHSLNFPSMSPFNTRFVQSPADSSSSYVGSSNRQTNALHYSESVASFSPLTSAHSLPECETVVEIDRD